MQLSVRITVQKRFVEASILGDQCMLAATGALGDEVVKHARNNTQAGVGPGPHPHLYPHTDTNDLRDSIERTDVRHRGFMMDTTVGTDLEYGLNMEIGWISAEGLFHRYPWLLPAVERTRPDAAKIVQAHWRIFAGGDSIAVGRWL
jgi:hypothetical protein